jgi:NDP-sugar pyrophosphorylase family protein
MKAVILAGGEGRRLLPYTTIFPKPMMPVGKSPILEILIRQLRDNGIRDVVVTTNYLGNLIRAYFSDGSKLGVSIRYSKEDRPLGTAGPLDLLRDELRETFLLANGDVLADVDYARLIEQHRRHGSDVTIVLAKRLEVVDFGIVHLDETCDLVRWTEKPTIEYLVSAGIYLFEPRVLDRLPPNEFFNIPDFMMLLKESGFRLKGFVHEGYWLDIGRPSDYERACQDAERFGW